MINIEMELDKKEAAGGKTIPGTAYTGNRDNFYLGFDEYKKDIRTMATCIQDKLEQLKEDKESLPWERY